MKVSIEYKVATDTGDEFSLTPASAKSLIKQLVTAMRATTVDIDLGALEHEDPAEESEPEPAEDTPEAKPTDSAAPGVPASQETPTDQPADDFAFGGTAE